MPRAPTVEPRRRTSGLRLRGWASFALVPALLCSLRDLGPVRPPEDLGAPRRDDDCARCHATIHAEWSASLHGQAWIDPVYQRAVARTPRRQRESCHRCHVPQPLLVTGFGLDERGRPVLPETRTADLDAGIHCATCHADGAGAMHGPHGAPTEAHATVRNETFLPGRSDALCLSCHSTQIGPVLPLGRDFVALRARDETKSCVGCHMVAVERPMAHAVDGTPGPVRAGRSHALRGATDAEFLAGALDVAVHRVAPGRLELRLTNQGVGHRTPGLVDRAWRLEATVVDAAGQRVRRADRLRAEIDHERPLHPGDVRTFALDTGGAEDARVQLHLSLTHPDRKLAPTVVVDRILEPR